MSRTELPPLQTHDLWTDEWVPPRPSRFCVYEKSDEAWLRPLGYGRTIRVIEPFYDVRDEQGELIGYTEYNPAELQRPWLTIAIHDPMPLSAMVMDDPSEKVNFRQLAIRTNQFRMAAQSIHGQIERNWIAWQAMRQDGPALVLSGWISNFGPDRKETFAHNLMSESFQRMNEKWRNRPTSLPGI